MKKKKQDALPIVGNNNVDVQSVQYILSKVTRPQCSVLHHFLAKHLRQACTQTVNSVRGTSFSTPAVESGALAGSTLLADAFNVSGS